MDDLQHMCLNIQKHLCKKQPPRPRLVICLSQVVGFALNALKSLTGREPFQKRIQSPVKHLR